MNLIVSQVLCQNNAYSWIMHRGWIAPGGNCPCACAWHCDPARLARCQPDQVVTVLTPARCSVRVRLPVHLHDIISRIRKTELELFNELQRRPTPDEVAEVCGRRCESLFA